MSTARTAPHGVMGEGVTVRSPKLLIANRPHAGTLIRPNSLRRLRHTRAFRRCDPSSIVVYRVLDGDHEQTGVVVAASIADYRNGRIRRHEATDPEREHKLVNHTETTGVEQIPVMLTHPPRHRLRELLASVADGRADLTSHTSDGQVHSVWVTQAPDLVHAVQQELNSVAALYIADGHHRMAAAELYSASRRQFDADDPAAFALGAIFPSDEMRVFGFPRCVPRTAEWSTAELLAALSRESAGIEECGPSLIQPIPGTATVFLDGRWFRMWLRLPQGGGRAALDVVALDERVIAPVFGETAPSTMPETEAAETIADWCTEHNTIGFLTHPPSVADIMAVADAGQVMPAKSTRFDPKVASGLFVRELT